MHSHLEGDDDSPVAPDLQAGAQRREEQAHALREESGTWLPPMRPAPAQGAAS